MRWESTAGRDLLRKVDDSRKLCSCLHGGCREVQLRKVAPERRDGDALVTVGAATK